MSRRSDVSKRLFFFVGTTLTLSTPLAFAEDIFEGDYEALDQLETSLSLERADKAAEQSEPEYIIVNAADLYESEVFGETTKSSPITHQVFYTSDTVAPQSESASSSRMDEFNRGMSQVVTLELDANFGDVALGPLIVETTLTNIVSVDARLLQDALEPLVDESTQILLSQFGEGFVSVERLQAIGVQASLNASTLSVDIEAPRKPNGPISLDLGGRAAPEGTVTASPANVAAGLTSTFLVNQRMSDDERTLVTSAVSGFVNVGGGRGVNLDFGGNITIDDGNGESRFDTDRTILFVDRPEQALRFEAGTLFTPLTGLSGEGDFLGIGVTKSYRELQPTRVLRPLGQRSFQLDSASEVTVLVDGRVVSRFDAPAGAINLNEIPLANVSNNVSIVVEDEFGRQEIENFSIASDAFLLEPGLSEYSLGIGQERDRNEIGFEYSDTTIAAGRFQFGVTPNLTAGVFGYAAEDLAVAGAESVFGVLDGIARVELGVSESDLHGAGAAASLDYRWANSLTSATDQSFAIALDYREEGFTPAGSRSGSSTKFDASAFYERQLTDNLRVNISGAYSEDYLSDGASTNLSLGTSYQIGRVQIGAGARIGSIAGRDEEVGAFFTITRRFGRRSSVDARYDTFNERSSLRYRRPSRNEIGSVGLESELLSRDDNVTLRGAVDYTANRYRTRLGVAQNSIDGQSDDETFVSARFQSGIAFADGKVGIGRDPGRGFVMIGRHKSLSDARVDITSRGRSGKRASTGAFGPAISRINSPFVPITTRIDVANAPAGYDVGEGSYYSVPGARSGIKITVGSDAYRSAVATFKLGDIPLGLAAGKLINLSTGTSQTTFTNSRGRALFSNLEPGKYRLEFVGTDTTFEFEIAADSETFSNLGTIDLSMEDTP